MYDHAEKTMNPSSPSRRTAARRVRRRTKRRRRAAMPAFFCALLFCSGFLLGKVSTAWAASGEASGNSAPQHTTAPYSPIQTPDGDVPDAVTPGDLSDGEQWKLLLVNSENPLPSDFSTPELTQLKGGYKIDSRAYPALQEMMDGARAAGYQPLICSAYRSREKQTQLFENKTQTYLAQGYSRAEAEEKAAHWVARPGTSEHETGLAVDIVDQAYQMLDQKQEDRPVQQWLMAHCAEYGFILRYPTEKSDLTGVGYEPWHYRYVGVEAAKAIMDQNLCLEEFLAQD